MNSDFLYFIFITYGVLGSSFRLPELANRQKRADFNRKTPKVCKFWEQYLPPP